MNATLTADSTGKVQWRLPEPPKRRLRDDFSDWMRTKNYARATIRTYVSVVLQFVAGITKKAGTHTFRHSYATHLIESGVAIQDVQALLGHSRIETTQIYIHVASPAERRVQSPLDKL